MALVDDARMDRCAGVLLLVRPDFPAAAHSCGSGVQGHHRPIHFSDLFSMMRVLGAIGSPLMRIATFPVIHSRTFAGPGRRRCEFDHDSP